MKNNYAKIEINGYIEVLTGLHIGGSSSFSAIGSVDSPIVKDVATGNPLIPGSSLKGKMRTLLAKYYNTTEAKDPSQDHPDLINLFGTATNNAIKAGKILFSDMVMCNWDELKKQGLRTKTEVKFENTINRLTAVATPRQIERVVRKAKFPLSLIYEVDKQEINLLYTDCEILRNGFKLIEADYLGGSGSRGYGKVAFRDLDLKVLLGELDPEILQKSKDIINK